jgi:hypothetical protein
MSILVGNMRLFSKVARVEVGKVVTREEKSHGRSWMTWGDVVAAQELLSSMTRGHDDEPILHTGSTSWMSNVEKRSDVSRERRSMMVTIANTRKVKKH